MKCKTKKEMKDAKAITMKNGKPVTQGTCPSCSTKIASPLFHDGVPVIPQFS